MSNPLSREETLFHAALALPTPAGRADYLRQACASDESLRQRVEALLRAAAARPA
jgi:predicted secreted protein